MPDASRRSPAVSIIVPVYRTERFLQECLESVAAQTYTDWECIIVDDGSDDPALIDVLARRTLRSKATVVHQSNQGVSAARNRGIANARAPLIVCLDSDDALHPEFLAKTVTALQADDRFGVAYCWTRHIGLRTDIVKPAVVEPFRLLQRNLIPVTALFKKEIWGKIGGFDETMPVGHEDWEFWIRTSLAGYAFTIVPEPLFYYRILSESRNQKATLHRVDTIAYIRHKHAAVYFMPLGRLLSYPPFDNVPRTSVIRFWLTGIFFHHVPAQARRMIFRLYQRFNGE